MLKPKMFLLISILVVCIITISIFVYQIRSNDSSAQHAKSNENMIAIEEFHITASKANLESKIEGTVFASGADKYIESIQIVATIQIDPLDWGGASFNLPPQWIISELKSSFVPEGETEMFGNDHYVSLLTTVDPEKKWTTIVNIAKSDDYAPLGGKGTIIINLTPLKQWDEQSPFNFSVAVGSQIRNGYRVSETDFIEVNVSSVTATEG
ncbi:hypothetical protein ACX1C1_12015 [Paenibacillus sp. strain BS8-2]